jgi:hypothetical protein
MQLGGCLPLDGTVAPIVLARRRHRGMPRHLLHGGQVHAQVEQIPDPGTAQVGGPEPGSGPGARARDRSARHRPG